MSSDTREWRIDLSLHDVNIVMEMTDNHAMLIPLMTAALIAHVTSRLICREGIYHALAHRLLESMRRPQLGR